MTTITQEIPEPATCAGCEGSIDPGPRFCSPCQEDISEGLRDAATGDLNAAGEAHYAEPATCPSCGAQLTYEDSTAHYHHDQDHAQSGEETWYCKGGCQSTYLVPFVRTYDWANMKEGK